MKKLFVIFFIMFIFFQFNIFGQDNPFIGTWILESDTRITRVFTATTRTNYFNGIAAPTPGSVGPTRYTYDSEKIYFTDIQSTRYGNIENNWSSEYSFIDGKLNLGGQIHFRDPEEVARIEREATRKEQEAIETAARREREATEAAARREREASETVAKKERETAEADARRKRNEGSLLLGYVYEPILPIGLQLGFIGERWGGYASIAIGLGLFDSEYKNLPETNVTYGYYLLDQLEIKKIMDIDFSFGIYYRIINNLFIDAGLGFYFYNTYGLYNVREAGKPYDPNSEPVWHEIVGNDGSGLLTGFSFKAGLMYAFKWFYLTAGYKHFLDIYDSTPSFYAGGGISIYFN